MREPRRYKKSEVVILNSHTVSALTPITDHMFSSDIDQFCSDPRCPNCCAAVAADIAADRREHADRDEGR